MDNTTKVKIKYEISEIDTLLEKSSTLISVCKSREPDFVETVAIGGILHSFYNGIENIFVLIAKSLGFDFKSSSQWHRNLVDFMFNQPNFLNADWRLQMTEYMGFRHFFRHTYGYTIKWDKCSHLFFDMTDFWTKIKMSLNNYCGLV